MTQNEQTHIALIVPRHPVELVRNKAEGDPVSPVKSTQCLEYSAPEGRVAGRIGREGWSEISPVGVAGRRAERNEVRNGGNRPPEHLVILRVPARKTGVGH